MLFSLLPGPAAPTIVSAAIWAARAASSAARTPGRPAKEACKPAGGVGDCEAGSEAGNAAEAHWASVVGDVPEREGTPEGSTGPEEASEPGEAANAGPTAGVRAGVNGKRRKWVCRCRGAGECARGYLADGAGSRERIGKVGETDRVRRRDWRRHGGDGWIVWGQRRNGKRRGDGDEDVVGRDGDV